MAALCLNKNACLINKNYFNLYKQGRLSLIKEYSTNTDDLEDVSEFKFRPAQFEKIVGTKSVVRHKPGDQVRKGQTLVTQLSISFHPGLNVGIGKNRTLFAEVDGTVMTSSEKLNPKWQNVWIKAVYGDNPAPAIYKTFYHVLPEPEEKKFHLIDLI